MRNLTLGDLKLVLRALLTDNLDVLRASATGRLYEPRLRAKKEAIEALPDAALVRLPFADELNGADAVHDGVGAAVFYMCEAILAHPALSEDVKRTAEVVRGTFIPLLSNLRQPFADEAAAALANRPKLVRSKAQLKAVQVPGGGSLYDWVKAFVDAGDAIDGLLRKRAHALATTEDASGSPLLRSATIGLLVRFREALRDEVSDEGSKLPRDHEAHLFAYFDKLASDRSSKSGREGAEEDPMPDTVPGDVTKAAGGEEKTSATPEKKGTSGAVSAPPT